MRGTQAVAFEIVNQTTGVVAQKGTMSPQKGDFGSFLLGDFSSLEQTGTFEIRSGTRRSGPLTIGSTVYDSAIQQMVGYFARQRCGDSKTGHHAPCHLDDGRRTDNHRHHDASGGWHDACDLRKWVDATIYGMIGLHRVHDLLKPKWDNGQILEEMRWGNRYFRKMQEPEGYVMDYCGGDDGNRYTDNVIDNQDDRLLHVDPCQLPAQFRFVAAQAAIAGMTRQVDPEYSRSCEESAQRCLQWCMKSRSPGAALSLAAGVIACVQLHRLTQAPNLPDLAANYLRKLRGLQVLQPPDENGSPRGYFISSPDHQEPLREAMHGNLPLLALCEALENFSLHADSGTWRDSLAQHAKHLVAMSDRSAFGTIPFGLYQGSDPGGDRRVGKLWYRWFMRTHNETSFAEWWVGVNAHLASNGVGLAKAGKLLKEPRLTHLAQRQLDWILGANPFDVSTVSGVGRNQPKLYVTSTFTPQTPLITGGVMNGIGGNESDQPALDSGSWNTCEYWTPMVCYTMWLAAELQADQI
jgi:hypothetical protein